MAGIALWITGLPGSGKSTVSDAVKQKHSDFVILRMDELRKVATPAPTYSQTERDILYRCLVFMAKTLTELGHDVIIDATGNMRKWRELARKLIPRYVEVYLKCSVAVCMEREKRRFDTHAAPEDIYEKGKKGWPVPGMAAPYEEPLNPELTVDTETVSVEDAVKLVQKAIDKVR
jgi:adenylylsulfate kinase